VRLDLLLHGAIDFLLTFRITEILGPRDSFHRLADRKYPEKDLPSFRYLLVDA